MLFGSAAGYSLFRPNNPVRGHCKARNKWNNDILKPAWDGVRPAPRAEIIAIMMISLSELRLTRHKDQRIKPARINGFCSARIVTRNVCADTDGIFYGCGAEVYLIPQLSLPSFTTKVVSVSAIESSSLKTLYLVMTISFPYCIVSCGNNGLAHSSKQFTRDIICCGGGMRSEPIIVPFVNTFEHNGLNCS